MKRVLILTAERTGTGHKSAANAIEKGLNTLGYETKQVDCFLMMSRIGKILENIYIPLTTTIPVAFYLTYIFSQKFPNVIHSMVYHKSHKKLKKEIDDFKPDLIVSVHSVYTKAITRLLKEEKLNIPFYIDVIDLIKPPHLWYDENADTIFVPTEEIKQDYLKKGFDKNKLIVAGFPINDKIKRRSEPKVIDGKINILMVNPSVYTRKNVKFVKEVSKLDNVNINVICGKDKKMYNAIIKRQEKGEISKEVKVHGFVKNMHEFLEESHILFTKAGPNMMLEGAKSSTAIIVTGHIQGQENYNYEYVTKNDFGFKCENPNKIYKELNDFITSGKINECLKNVLHAECNSGTEIITDYIAKNIK